MRTLKQNDYKLFEQIASLSQGTLMQTMYSFLKKQYNEVVGTKDYIYAAGDIPIALVAHLDTVFKMPPTNIYYDERKNVMWSPEGLGADDRAGVFAIIKIIRAGYKPHIIFTTDEEKGALGATMLIHQVPQPFADMKYIIQLDRRGTSDCVFYNCANEAFIEYVEKFGFIENFGSFSDISEICPAWKVAGVNLSVGYEDEHSVSETLHITPLLTTIDRVINMLKDAENAPSFKYIPGFSYAYGWGKAYKDAWLEDDTLRCVKCKQLFSEYELFPVKCVDGKTRFYCPDCMTDILWCEGCGQPYEPDAANPSKFCKDCQGGKKSCGTSNKSKVKLKV